MVNLKNYNHFLKLFVIFLTFVSIISCSDKSFSVTKIESKQISITGKENQNTDIENFISPYRAKINSDLDKVLAYNPETLDKSKGKWQTTIGNFIADVTLEKANFVFNKRENKNVDICLLNHGGIRSILPKGNVTSRTAYEIMPFENSLFVVSLKGDQVKEIADFIIADKKPHPLAGLTFSIDKNNQSKNILVQGKPLETNAVYYVATNDYLVNGGDNMAFFQKEIQKFDLEYKLRNILIDYFSETDTITVKNDIRILAE
ncbi:5'-nucleotidase-like protein [Flavobacterium sp. 1]|uniref:5'-nucleotidase C-terminal domain-containing protein n=1 Tax=Flavobacterium sp. 1 TaxID=2035200 RepID=UPI000C243C63|nr:5'-nucleotidase [Flavobacterium sp. 1]PJJ07463.1 5'-nucleotidase-like protein [Flavobacterium sp. 1]